MFCNKCGTEASADARFCPRCGTFLDERSPEPAPDRGDVEYVEAAIGPRNTDYYAQRFARFASGGGFASWNWPAFFVPLLWMLYRKMWGVAAFYFFATPFLLGLLFAVLFLVWPGPTAAAVGWIIYLAAVFVVLPM